MNGQDTDQATMKDGFTIQPSNTDETEITEKLSDMTLQAPKTPGKFYMESWTPEHLRDKCTATNKSKVQFSNSPMVGGDFLCNKNGETVTLSFGFEGPENSRHEGKNYGLTCGHIGTRLGERLYTFSSNIPNGNNDRPTKVIGIIVSMDPLSDSLIFEFSADVKVELYNSDKWRHYAYTGLVCDSSYTYPSSRH
ncbi:MAG: hypothetical protein SGARI_003408 [Bacillariaceae sp.]